MTNPRAAAIANLRSLLEMITRDRGINALIEAKTQEQYRARLWQAVLRLYSGGRDANFIATFIRSIDQQLTEAWNKGAASVGVQPDEMNAEDAVILEAIINNETEFIERLADDISADVADGLTREQLNTKYGARVDLWANRYKETENRARMHFGDKARLEWVRGATEQHCDTCSRLNGIIAFGYEWEEARLHPQMPPNELLECGGWHCDCELRPTTRRRTPRALDRLLNIVMGAR